MITPNYFCLDCGWKGDEPYMQRDDVDLSQCPKCWGDICELETLVPGEINMIGDKERFHDEIAEMAAQQDSEYDGLTYVEMSLPSIADEMPMILRPRTPFDARPLLGATPDMRSMIDR